MLALSGDELLMDHRSELGPIDPQIRLQEEGAGRWVPADSILKGFEECKKTLEEQPQAIPAYVPLIRKYSLDLFEICNNASALSKRLVKNWLRKYMLNDDSDDRLPSKIARRLSSHYRYLSHSRFIGIDEAIEMGLKVDDLRKPESAELGELLWVVYLTIERFFETPAYKIFENCHGCRFNRFIQTQQIEIPLQIQPAQPAKPGKKATQGRTKKRRKK
jgi:hypothetical protein